MANSLERDGLRQANLPKTRYMKMTAIYQSMPDRSSPGLPRTAPAAAHQGGGGKFVTDETTNKIRARNNISIGTWNVRTLREPGKLEILAHEMDRYHWHILGLCEVRWKNIGETLTHEGHKLYFSGKKDKHEQGVGFLINKEIVNTVMGCRPVSSRLISIRLRANPFNITIIQAYAPTSSHDDAEVEEFYDQLQEILEQTPKKDILVVQGDWNAKVGEDACQTWKGICGRYSNKETNDRGLRLLEFASYNDLRLMNTFGPHKASRRWTWHSPDGNTHNQIDYILVKKRFRSCVNIAKTRSFPGADIGSDHELVMMSFRTRLKKIKRQGPTRIKFDLEKLKDPDVAEAFQAMIGGKFAPLTILDADDTDVDTLIDTFNSAVTESAKELLGKHRPVKRPWITPDILALCDKRRDIKKKKGETEGAKQYREISQKIKKSLKKAKETWIEEQCQGIDDSLKRNNSKKAYQLVKKLTSKKQERPTTIQDKQGKIQTEEQEILGRWTEYCADLYQHKANGDAEVLNVPPATDTDLHPILREEVEAAVKSLKKGKSPGVDNIPSELVQAGGEDMITVLLKICNKIWQTGDWPTPWTQSLVITLPKKGNLQQCQNYRTISLICHPSKVMLKILLNRLKPQAELIIAEEQAGFRAGRSTTEQIFNLRLICEKYLQHQQDLYHVFVDFKKAFDRVWHAALWATMRFYNINANLIRVIEQLYNKATSAVYYNGSIGEWFRTSVGVRQGCLLSPTLFNIFLERIMADALQDHEGTVSIGGRTITNLRFADDIDGLAGDEEELARLVERLDKTSSAYGMEISEQKTKLMTNTKGISRDIKVGSEKLETVKSFKYLGAIVTDQGSKPEVIARIAQTIAALTKLRTIWSDKHITLKSKVRLMRSLVFSIFLYACESWTLTKDLERRIQATEMRCYRRLLGISYKDRITNEEVKNRVQQTIGPFESLLSSVKKRKLKWYGHTVRSSGLAKTILQGTVRGRRARGRPKKRWEDNIQDWTGLRLREALREAEDREGWRMMAVRSSVAPQRSPGLRDM